MKESKWLIIEHYKETIRTVRGLSVIKESAWKTPVSSGKWTVAEVIGHLFYWDEFLVAKRLPYVMSDEPFPPAPHVGVFNEETAKMSRSQTQEEVIQRFTQTREELIEAIQHLPPYVWDREYSFGANSLLLATYFRGLLKHDEHHFNQIKDVLYSS